MILAKLPYPRETIIEIEEYSLPKGWQENEDICRAYINAAIDQLLPKYPQLLGFSVPSKIPKLSPARNILLLPDRLPPAIEKGWFVYDGDEVEMPLYQHIEHFFEHTA